MLLCGERVSALSMGGESVGASRANLLRDFKACLASTSTPCGLLTTALNSQRSQSTRSMVFLCQAVLLEIALAAQPVEFRAV